MTGLHFRRYELKPDAMPDFLGWWRQIQTVRERYGLTSRPEVATGEQ